MNVISNSDLVEQRASSLGKIRTECPITTQPGPATYARAPLHSFFPLMLS